MRACVAASGVLRFVKDADVFGIVAEPIVPAIACVGFERLSVLTNCLNAGHLDVRTPLTARIMAKFAVHAVVAKVREREDARINAIDARRTVNAGVAACQRKNLSHRVHLI